MTLHQVAGAVATLKARGAAISQRAILRELGAGSKRDVAKYLRQLDQPTPAEDETGTPDVAYGSDPEPAAAPDPALADPVARAETRLREAEQALALAREHLLECKLELMAMQPLKVQDLLRGSLQASDEALPDALRAVESAKQDYDRAWREREDAKAELARVEAVHVRRHQEAWVARAHPELVAALAYWQEKLRTAPSDRMSAEAKKNVGEAQMAYEYAVRTAPWSSNGVTREESHGRVSLIQ